MYIIKHFCTDDKNTYRVILEYISSAKQVFHGSKEECEYYIRIMNDENILSCQKNYILKYANDMNQLKIALM